MNVTIKCFMSGDCLCLHGIVFHQAGNDDGKACYVKVLEVIFTNDNPRLDLPKRVSNIKK